ncbi:MAG: CBS domain-containing protein [Clostridiales bacterium]|jgi:mannose-1-phosphate guanylyltransferase/mannose-6-phosphate isomerase|nr:CBS domain-containing protein [Clostridiales bacterium]
MGFSVSDFTISKTDTALHALRKIDSNAKGFLIVVESRDSKNYLLGALTDGDLRRAFIAGKSLYEPIESVYNRSSESVNARRGIADVIELFKNDSIDFLPIVKDDGEVINIITKKQLHSLLLTDRSPDLSDDFTAIDEGLIDYEIFPRPWGFYKTTLMNDYFQSKVVTVYPGASLSLQSHNRREEYWIIAHGTGAARIGESIISVHCGSSLFIPKGCKHRLTNSDNSENLIFIEVQIGDYFGEDDINRYEDQYGRVAP